MSIWDIDTMSSSPPPKKISINYIYCNSTEGLCYLKTARLRSRTHKKISWVFDGYKQSLVTVQQTLNFYDHVGSFPKEKEYQSKMAQILTSIY